jgi:hypothetical protein
MKSREAHKHMLSYALTLMLGMVVVAGLILLTAGFALAGEERTLFSDRDYDHGGMGAFHHGMGSFAGETQYMTGWQGQWVINHKFGIGVMGYNSGPEDGFDVTVDGTEYNVEMAYAGLDFECFDESDRMLHCVRGLTIGGGSLISRRNLDDKKVENSGFFMIVPRAGLEVNVVDWMRVSVVGSYRFGSGLDSKLFDNGDLRGWTVMAGFKFGSF